MNGFILLITIFLPIFMGLSMLVTGFSKKEREIFCMIVVCINSLLVFYLIAQGSVDTTVLCRLTNKIDIAFRVDGISRIFALLVSVLWPIATLWSYEYMYHEGRENQFFGLYTATYGVTLGICFAANLVSMYLFYELLTLITVPLIMHSRNQFSKQAGIKYIAYSIAGATAAFAGIMLIYSLTGTFDYVEGGLFSAGSGNKQLIYIAFMLMFFGFGVKAAVFPLYEWLPAVGVAPTPVTALLHAVAVVKSGCYAIIRITYYIFGVSVLRGSWAQDVALIFVSFTIAFGSIWAYRETHFKRRLAMSTVSNLSYILLGAMLMSTAGLTGGFLHMLFHGVMKITLFFVAGTCHVQAHADYVSDLKGYGRKMPVTFAAFTISSVALVGIPPFCGFYSKWIIGSAAVEEATPWGYLGIAALLISAVFTALYLFPIVIRAYFPEKDFDYASIENVADPTWKMKVPFVILAILCIALGFAFYPVAGFISTCIGGLC